MEHARWAGAGTSRPASSRRHKRRPGKRRDREEKYLLSAAARVPQHRRRAADELIDHRRKMGSFVGPSDRPAEREWDCMGEI